MLKEERRKEGSWNPKRHREDRVDNDDNSANHEPKNTHRTHSQSDPKPQTETDTKID
jgi:hypothetical protein